MAHSFDYSNPFNMSSGTSMDFGETLEESRIRRKELIKTLLEDDDYLLQEAITDLRNDKLKQLMKKKE